ncbi:hypothetical protein Q5P01_015581 [Channa striata]|uniref:Ig-like domain-containing protein n=1 Tax=Channa striata TaxID=64152 RepID=A0AA88MFC3_CHASR|nr:hypothetical protein Q5P01_015581 [Channa striata]
MAACCLSRLRVCQLAFSLAASSETFLRLTNPDRRPRLRAANRLWISLMRNVNVHRGDLPDPHSQHYLRQKKTRSNSQDGLSCDFNCPPRMLVCWCHEEDDPRHQNETAGSYNAPSIQILSSVPFSQDPGAPVLLVCLLSGLNSPVQDILWWVDETVVTSACATVSFLRSEEGGAYSASSVWEVSAADWNSSSTYWCGTIQEGQVYREKFCS